MSIYASAVALWFMAIALFLTGASIRGWFRSPRAYEYAVIARRPMRMTRPSSRWSHATFVRMLRHHRAARFRRF
jgi:hypothetical protein